MCETANQVNMRQVQCELSFQVWFAAPDTEENDAASWGLLCVAHIVATACS